MPLLGLFWFVILLQLSLGKRLLVSTAQFLSLFRLYLSNESFKRQIAYTSHLLLSISVLAMVSHRRMRGTHSSSVYFQLVYFRLARRSDAHRLENHNPSD